MKTLGWYTRNRALQLTIAGSLAVGVALRPGDAAAQQPLVGTWTGVLEVAALEMINHLFQPATTGAPGEYALIEVTIDPSVLDLVTEWILERFGG